MSVVEPSFRSASAATPVKVVIGGIAGVTGALTAIMTALQAGGPGPSSLSGYAAALCLALLMLVSVLLVTLGRGHGWPRLLLAALFWIFLTIQIVSFAIAGAHPVAAQVFLTILAAVNLLGAVTLHTSDFRAWLARAGARRTRRFGPGFEWVLASGTCAIFATASTGSGVVPRLWAWIAPDQPFSHGAHFGLAVAGVALAGLTISCLPRTRTPLVILLAFDLIAAGATILLRNTATSGAVGFSLVVLALSATGLLASFQKGFGLLLAQLGKRGRGMPQVSRRGSSVGDRADFDG
jgi:hypothetical protein